MMTTDKTTYSAASSCGKLRRMLVWLSRMRHSRGFGVQSPWAYRMVRYVINEHYPYYAYDDLALSYPGLGVVERKMCELCLRLANSVQPSLVVNFDDAGGAYGAYFGAGCRKARVESVSSALSPVRLSDMIGGCSRRFGARAGSCARQGSFRAAGLPTSWPPYAVRPVPVRRWWFTAYIPTAMRAAYGGA